MSPPGRPKGESRSAQHEGLPLPGSPLPRRTMHVVLAMVAVALLHWAVVSQLDAQMRLGLDELRGPPQRLQALFVRTLQPEVPVWAPLTPLAVSSVVAPGPGAGWIGIPAVALAASAASSDAGPEAPAEPGWGVQADAEPQARPGPDPAPQTAVADPAEPAESNESNESAEPTEPPLAAETGDGAPRFEWPPSTRLRYVLTGDYRGPIDGSAEVQWIREGNRYQVHLDVVVGLKIAPLISRQMSSDGTLGPEGLVPGRYDERTRILLRDPVLHTLRFDGRQVQLSNGRRVPQPPAVQDSVSQFVQLTWRFLTQPALLQAGQVLTVPLALPRGVSPWVYDVRETETLYTPVGAVEAVHVQPRRQARGGGDLVAEMWFAPSLQSLPVRILIRQDAQTYVDLLIDRLPEQALQPPGVPAPPAPPGPASSPKRAP